MKRDGKDTVNVPKDPRDMWAVFRRCKTSPDWSLDCICDENRAQFLCSFKDFRDSDLPGIVKLIGLKRAAVAVKARLIRRKDEGYTS